MSEKSTPLGALLVIGVVILLMVGVANVAHAADRTVLDDETVIETMDEEGVFAILSQDLQDEVAGEVRQATQNEEIEPIVFDQYVADLDTTVTVQIDGLNQVYGDIIENQLDIDALTQEAFSEQFIRDEATRNIQQFYAYLQGDTDSLDIVVDLTEPRDVFLVAISDLRAEIQQNPQVISDSIDDATLDQIIEEEIDRLVNEELDDEIRQAAAQPGSPSEEEIEQQVREDLQLEIDNRIDDELQSPQVTDTVDSALADAEGELQNELSEEEELTEDEEPPEELDDARDALGWFSIMLWALPVAALGLVGGGYAYTRSLHQTGAMFGGALLGAGILGLVIGFALPGTVESAAESAIETGTELEATVLDAVLALIGTLFSAIATQSLLLTIAGLGLIGVVYADTNGYFDSFRGGDGPAADYRQQEVYEQQQYQTGQTEYQEGQSGQYQANQPGQYQSGQSGQYQEGTYQEDQHRDGQPQGDYQAQNEPYREDAQTSQYQQGQSGQYQQAQTDQYQQSTEQHQPTYGQTEPQAGEPAQTDQPPETASKPAGSETEGSEQEPTESDGATDAESETEAEGTENERQEN